MYLLVAIREKASAYMDSSPYTILQILKLTLFEKIPISQALTEFTSMIQESDTSNQLKLFDY